MEQSQVINNQENQANTTEEGQASSSQQNQRNNASDIFKKMPEKKSKLPLINTVISAITLFVAIVILVVVIMSSLRGPTMLGGGDRINGGFPQGGPTQIGGEQRDSGNGGS